MAEFLSVKDLAVLLQCSEKTIRRRLAEVPEGVPWILRDGHLLRIQTVEYIRFCNERRTKELKHERINHTRVVTAPGTANKRD